MHGCTLKFGVAALVASVFSWSSAALAQARLEIEAFSGKPFGIARVALQVDARAVDGDPRDTAAVTERNGRVFYPAYETGPVRRLLREFLAAPARVNVYFLFTGDQPLELTLYSPAPAPVTVRSRRDDRAFDRLLRVWWREYSQDKLQLLSRPSEYPPVVENYLTAMLSQRLRLPLADRRSSRGGSQGDLQGALSLLAGTESMQLATEQRIMLGGPIKPQAADRPLPPPVELPPLAVPPIEEAPAIEPIATRVPPECFYLRFGTFSNYLWFRHRLDAWGGDVRNLVLERGLDYRLNARLERQLGLHESALSQLLGDTVIADAAFIGTDTFMREGAAMGMLFQARSNPLLGNDLARQRREAMGEVKGTTETKVSIAGREVSLISSPDNVMRSFYVVDGDYHLVTTSQSLVKRFLEVGKSGESLGATAEFRHARSRMSVDRGDTVFIYLSSAFFHNLLGPQYYLEMLRRARSLAEMDLLVVARHAAAGEKQKADSIADLIQGGFLPAGFGARSDGSKLVIGPGASVSDSLRGGRGTFAPVPDVRVEGVTAEEAQAYRMFADYYEREWQQTEPVLVALKRENSKQRGLEHVTIDLVAAPMTPNHFAKANQWIGPPSDQRLTAVPSDVVAFQVGLRGNNLFSGPGDYFLFGGLRDAVPAPVQRLSLVDIIGMLSGFQGVHGYVGTWPEVGILKWIGGASDVPADPDGFSQLRTGLVRRQWNGFTALSFHGEVLAEVTPRLEFEKTERPAQLWVRAGDLLESKLADFINNQGFRRARDVSRGNIRFLHSLSEQLHIPREQALDEAQWLLNAQLACPLGGEYRLVEQRGGLKTWTSTMLEDGERQSATDYRFPALHWLRELNLEAALGESALEAHADLEMPTEVATPKARQAAEKPAPSPAAPPTPPAERPPAPRPR